MINTSIKVMKVFCLGILLFVAYPFDTFSSVFKTLTLAKQNDVIQAYWGSFNKFKTKVCEPSDKATFDKLFKEYKGAGYYIPLYNEKIVKESIHETLPILDNKILWLRTEITKLEKLKELPNFSKIVEELNLLIENNTKLRYQIDIGNSTEALLKNQAKEQVVTFKKRFKEFTEAVFYLKNFTYPVDHLLNRLTYDRLANQPIPAGTPAGSVPQLVIKKLNLYLKRKILEDGAMDPDLTRTDLYLRTTLDTFTLSLGKIEEYFTPELISDWEWLAKSSQGIYARGLNQQKLRLNEWLGRTIATKDYYVGLLKQVKFIENKFISDLAESSDHLKSFVQSKLAGVYKYWLNQPEILRNLFVVETILMHEVGSTDPIGDQRKKVVEVVLNRVYNKKYRSLKSTDPWETLLGTQLRAEKNWWLNVMYRSGEFSFMYFFMTSSYKVFCPEETPTINNLRENNLKIALEVLKTYEPLGIDSTVYNYFSRVSMLGRIDMTSVWSPPFELVEETPGSHVESAEQEKLLKTWQQGQWKYFYSFKEGLSTYRVFELDGKLWTTLWDKNVPTQFYHYRDRDYFKYFRLPR